MTRRLALQLRDLQAEATGRYPQLVLRLALTGDRDALEECLLVVTAREKEPRLTVEAAFLLAEMQAA